MSKLVPKNYRRRNSLRLKGYDYSSVGAYFVTIVTWQREMLFGEVVNGVMLLDEMGKIVQKWWYQVPKHFPNVELGTFVIMPNHVHVIIIITEGRGGVSPPDDGIQNQTQGEMTSPLHRKNPTLGQIIAYFKYQSTKELNALDGLGEITKFWQRNYYDRIIRNKREMSRIWDYIEANPTNWTDDKENPRNWEIIM